MSDINIEDIRPQFYIKKINGTTYIRLSIMGVFDEHRDFDAQVDGKMKTDTSGAFRTQGKEWQLHLEKIESDFDAYKGRIEYKEIAEWFERFYERGNLYFRKSLLKIDEHDDLTSSREYVKKAYRPAVLELLKIGYKIRKYDFIAILFYDSESYNPRMEDSFKKEVERDVQSFVNKYGLLGMLTNLDDLNKKRGFDVPVYETFLYPVELMLNDIMECFATSGYPVEPRRENGVRAINTPLRLVKKDKYYVLKDRRHRISKEIRSYETSYQYAYKYRNEIIQPPHKTHMPMNEYLHSFFPTHKHLLGCIEGVQLQSLYSEPLSVFLYAVKSFYLMFMYTHQMFTQRRASVDPGDTRFIQEPQEIFKDYFKILNAGDKIDEMISPAFDVLLHKALNDIVKNEHSIIVCPICGEVSLTSDTNMGKIYCCEPCARSANDQSHKFKKNKAVKPENIYNIVFRPALQYEVDNIVSFYENHAEHPLPAVVKAEMLSIKTNSKRADLFVAELEGEIIGLYIDGLFDGKRTGSGSCIVNEDYKHTNVKALFIEWFCSRTHKKMQSET